MKILGSVWFSSIDDETIGVVLMNDGFKDKAYIGIGKGIVQKEDELEIARAGGPFPLKQAKEMIGKS